MKKITLSIIKKSIIEKIRFRRHAKVPSNEFGNTAVAIVAMILVSATAVAEPPTGNLLSDVDFSSNTILAPFGSSVSDQWKDEAAQIAIGTVEGINPQSPDGMLQLNETGGFTSQVRQSIDVSDYASEIDAGTVSAIARAFYNCPTEACNAALSIRNTASRLRPLEGGLTIIRPLNGDPEVWQEANVGLMKPVAIPPGTRSIDIEVSFSNGTIPSGGFVDDTFLELRFSQCEAQGEVIAGETVQVNYKGLEPDQEILAFLVSNQVLDGEFADANGEGTIQLPIPSNTPEGTHLITIEHDGSDLTSSCTVKTLPSPPPPKACNPDAPGVNPIIGTEGKDFLRGTPGDDVIIGLGGNDIIIGFGGNDCIDGGEGNDLILGRKGDDKIIGGPGNDRIFSNSGADMVAGGTGDDLIFGGAGDDQIDGNDGEDKINGGPGMDACANGMLTQCELDIPPQSIVSGRIFEADGSAVPGVVISAFKNGKPFTFPNGESTVSPDSDGNFEVFLAIDEEVTLKFVAEGYASQVLPVKAPSLEDGKVSLDVMMIARGEAQIVNAFAGGSVADADGAYLTVTGGSFVNEAGNPLIDSDDINVTLTPADISTAAGVATFPGKFSGVPENETTESPILSYGVVEFKLTLEGTDEEVFLAKDQTANILIPLYKKGKQEGGSYAVGDSIPLWYLDETTGTWVQEGSGIVVNSFDSPTGLALQSTVSHFSWWNCGVSMNPALVAVSVFGNQDGTALIKARTTANIGTFIPTTVDTSILVGGTTRFLPVPSNGETCVWAEIDFIDGSRGTTLKKCINPDPLLSDASRGIFEEFRVTLDLSSALIAIIARPTVTGPIEGVKNGQVKIIKLQPLTKETVVKYKVTNGLLPDGMKLGRRDNVTTEIVGIPTKVGDFTVEITGTDSEDNTDTIILNYSILDKGLQPLIWQDDISVATEPRTWSGAVTHCDDLELYGRNDWKLPTKAHFYDMFTAASSFTGNFFDARSAWNNIFTPPPPNEKVSAYWLADNSGNKADIFVMTVAGDFAFLPQVTDLSGSDKIETRGVRCVIGEPVLTTWPF
ncbi:MAG: hypothetical protein V3V31_03060 [Methylococcales bacterium]